MADFLNAYGAGLRHAWIKTSTGDVYDIDAVVSLEADPEQEETEVRGDDTVKAVFASSRKETLTISANAVSMDVIQAISGNSISSSATGASIAVGTVAEMSPPYVEVGTMTNGKTKDGTACVIEKVFHKVQLNSIKTNMAGETEFSVEIEGFAVQTANDITDVALASTRTSTINVYQGTAE